MGFTIIGVLIIIYGLILSTGRKFMMSREYDIIFVIFINAINPIIKYIEKGYALSFLHIVILPACIILPVCVVVIIILRGKYTLTNVNSQMVSSTLTDILKEKGIGYDEENNDIILKDYDNKRISYTQSLNSVEVNLIDISNFSFYKGIKKELKYRIKKIETRIFPTTGLFFIVLGLITIAIPQYIEKVL